jgi:hypothetical protein
MKAKKKKKNGRPSNKSIGKENKSVFVGGFRMYPSDVELLGGVKKIRGILASCIREALSRHRSVTKW